MSLENKDAVTYTRGRSNGGAVARAFAREGVSIPQLRATLNGRVIAPDDAGYDEARTVFYGGFDRRPAVIVRAVDATDVSRVVSLARETGLELAVRSGGHSVAGHGVSDGGIVLDLSDMRALQINAERRTAWAETGLTAGEYTSAAGAHGLATGFGDTGSVGIGGITLGGGVGYLLRKHGLTIDDLLAADVVTADGRLLRVDAETHPDLFWAIRGGGGNFGVATRFQFRLHEVATIVGGMLILPATRDVIASFIAEAEAAPDELSTIASVMTAPPMPFLPAEYYGKLVVMAMLVYAGEATAGERVIAPFRALATPIADMIRPMHYPEVYPPEQPGYHPVAAARTMFVDAIDRSVAGMILDHLRASTASMAVAQLRVLGGAMARVPVEATAFAHRGRRIMVNVAALYEHPDEAAVHEAWVTGFAAALCQGKPGAYVNFLGDEGEARVREAYPGATWDQLVAIKRRYDPTNLFRLNQNIPPGTLQQESTGDLIMNKTLAAKATITINAPTSKVWDALTKPHLIKQYLFGTEVTTDWQVGSPITYKGIWEGKAYEDKGRVLQIKPGNLLVSTFWSSLSGLPDIPENYKTVRYELAIEGDGTRLTITQDNNDSQEEANHSEQNWKMVLDGMKKLLEG